MITAADITAPLYLYVYTYSRMWQRDEHRRRNQFAARELEVLARGSTMPTADAARSQASTETYPGRPLPNRANPGLKPRDYVRARMDIQVLLTH